MGIGLEVSETWPFIMQIDILPACDAFGAKAHGGYNVAHAHHCAVRMTDRFPSE